MQEASGGVYNPGAMSSHTCRGMVQRKLTVTHARCGCLRATCTRRVRLARTRPRMSATISTYKYAKVANGSALGTCWSQHANAPTISGLTYCAAGCTFADFSGNEVITLGDGDASISRVNCTLEGKTAWPDTWYDGGHALISAVSSEYRDDYAPWKILATTVLVRMETCLLVNNSVDHPLVATGAVALLSLLCGCCTVDLVCDVV